MIGKRKRVGLALGGGGARGMAHIGVLRVFEDESIPIDLVVGTSVGALVGGAFASGFGTYELERKIEEFLESPVFKNSALRSIREIQASKKLSLPQKIQAFFKNRFFLAQAMFRPGMLHSEDFQAMIDFFVPDIDVQETQLPFRAVATDLVSGKPLVISRGSLRRAVMASCAVPGAVPPLLESGMVLADGGIIYMVPTTVARDEGAEFVVAVSVNADLESNDDVGSAMDIYVRATNIGGYYLEKLLLEQTDVAIRPRVGDRHWTDFVLAADLIREGERAARDNLHLLRRALPLPRRLAAMISARRHIPGGS